MKLDLIHKDKRGFIYSLTGDMDTKEISIVSCNSGYSRGGCIHRKHDEHCVLYEGEMEFHVGDKIYHMKNGDSIIIPKGTPHYMIAKKNCIFSEWGCDIDEKQEKDINIRKIVENINDNIHG